MNISPSQAASGNKTGMEKMGSITQFCRPDFITISLHERVGDAIRTVRRSAEPGNIFYLYVTNERQELCGIVSIRSLLLAKDETLVSQIYSPKVVALNTESPVRQAYETFANSRFLSLPVVDTGRHILGVVHAHEIAGDFKPSAQESLFEDRTRAELFGLLGIKAEDVRRGPTRAALGRFPWLMVNISGGTLCASLIHWLGGRLDNAVEFLAFVPVLLAISESIGMQTASMAIANLHGTSSSASIRLLLREWLIASLLGLACALVFGSALFLWKGSFALTLTVTLTIFFGCLVVSFVGNAVPFLFHRWKVDPRVAAGPVVLSVADCATLLLYLVLALFLSRVF